MATQNNNDIMMEGLLKKQAKTLVGSTKWLSRYFQVTNTCISEYFEKPIDSKQSLPSPRTLQGSSISVVNNLFQKNTKEEKNRSWLINSIGVIAHDPNPSESFCLCSAPSSKLKLVFTDGQHLILMASNHQEARKWIQTIKRILDEQEKEHSILESYSRIMNDFDSVCNITLDQSQKLFLKEKCFRHSAPSSLVLPSDLEREFRVPKQPSKSLPYFEHGTNQIQTCSLPTQSEQKKASSVKNRFTSSFLQMPQNDEFKNYQDLVAETFAEGQQSSCDFDLKMDSISDRDLLQISEAYSRLQNTSMTEGALVQVSEAYSRLQNQSLQKKKEAEKNQRKFEEYSQKIKEMEHEVEEAKKRTNDPTILNREKLILEREQKLETLRDELTRAQLKIIADDEKSKEDRINHGQLSLENKRNSDIQKQKMVYIQNKEKALKTKEQELNSKNRDLTYVSNQLSTKIEEYNQRAAEMNRRGVAIRYAEQKNKEKAKELELKERELSEIEIEARKKAERKKNDGEG